MSTTLAAGSKRSHKEALGSFDQVQTEECEKLLMLIKRWSEEEDGEDDAPEYQRRLLHCFNKTLRRAHPDHASKIFSELFGRCWDPEANHFRDTINVRALLERAEQLEQGRPSGPPSSSPSVLEPCAQGVGWCVAKPKGIKNEMQMCYLIVTVQFFNAIPAVRRAILEIRTGLEDWPEDSGSEAIVASQVTPQKRFVHLLQEVLHGLGQQGSHVNTNDLALQLQKITATGSAQPFKYGEQHDAHEFAAKTFDVVQRLDTSGVLGEYFGGSWRQVIKIDHAPEVIELVSEKVLDFSSPSEPTIACDSSASLIEALQKSVSVVPLRGENQYKDANGSLRDATKLTHFAKIPTILCLTLQFLPLEDGQKAWKHFSYDEQIELTEVGEDGSMEIAKTYTLIAVIAHDGNTMHSGHYWIYVHQQDRWFRLDCDDVQECDRVEACGGFACAARGSVRSAYVLCYVDLSASSSLFSPWDMQYIDALMAKRQEGYTRLVRTDSFRSHMHLEDVNDVTLCPTYPEHLFSRVKIDTTFTGFGPEQVRVVQRIYELLQHQGNKLEYFQGYAKFAMRDLDFLTPKANVENYIFGDCQSGKSAEAAFAAWCSAIILGCLPIVLLRNNGGKVQGLADMRKAMRQMNERVESMVKEHFPREDPENYKLLIVDNIDKLRECCFAHRKIKPTVFISLNNPTQLWKLFFKTIPNKKWYPAQVLEKHGDDTCTVRYNCSNDTERLPLDVNVVRHFKKKNRPIEVGNLVEAAMSDELKTQEGVFNLLLKLGPKDDKVRATIIADEADLAVGGPKRNGNQGEKLHHHEMPEKDSEIYKMFGARRGIREYAYGSICITATPAAPLLCEWPKETCGLCLRDLVPSDDGSQLHCAMNHLFHQCCVDDFLDRLDGKDEGFTCPTCERMRSSKAQAAKQQTTLDEDEDEDDNEDDDEDDEDELGKSVKRLHSPDDFRSIVLPDNLRSFMPHVVRTTRPSNYFSFPEFQDSGENCKTIERMETPERIKRTRTKLEIYQALFLGTDYGTDFKVGTEEEWNAMAKKAREGDAQDLGWGRLRLRACKGSLQVSPQCKSRTREESEVFDRCRKIYDSYKQIGGSAWEVDNEGIVQMITHMWMGVGGGDPFRNGLVLSENTKNINQQIGLQDSIAKGFNYLSLVVARYECRTGITMLFTQSDRTADEHKALMEKALETARLVYTKEKGHEWEQEHDPTQKRCKDFRSAAETAVSLRDHEGISALQINESNINLFYETIKLLDIRLSIVITGAIGGRGVSYHDLKHERILTDMYSGMSVDPNKALPSHGEDLIQRLGRLNTIETFSAQNPHVRVPTIRLWASPSFHKVHKHYIRWLLDFVKAVEEFKDCKRALESTPRWYTGDPDNKSFHTKPSRPSFSKRVGVGAKGPEHQVQLPVCTSRTLDLSHLTEENTRSESVPVVVTADASAIHVSDIDMLLRRELLALDETQRIVVPNIISCMREDESLKADDPAMWMSKDRVWNLLPAGLTEFISRETFDAVFQHLYDLGLDRQAKLVRDVNVDDVYIGLSKVEGTVELLQSAIDWDKTNNTYKQKGLYSIRDMPVGAFCNCSCPNDAARVLQKSDLRRCTICLWHYHTCKGETSADSESDALVCSACRQASGGNGQQ